MHTHGGRIHLSKTILNSTVGEHTKPKIKKPWLNSLIDRHKHEKELLKQNCQNLTERRELSWFGKHGDRDQRLRPKREAAMGVEEGDKVEEEGQQQRMRCFRAPSLPWIGREREGRSQVGWVWIDVWSFKLTYNWALQLKPINNSVIKTMLAHIWPNSMIMDTHFDTSTPNILVGSLI